MHALQKGPFLAGESVRELSSVVREDRLDVHRRGIF